MSEENGTYVVEYVTMTEPIQVISIELPEGCTPPHVLECTRTLQPPLMLYRTAAIWDEERGLPIDSRPYDNWEELEAPSPSEDDGIASEESDTQLDDEPDEEVVLTTTLEQRLELMAEEWRRNKVVRPARKQRS